MKYNFIEEINYVAEDGSGTEVDGAWVNGIIRDLVETKDDLDTATDKIGRLEDDIEQLEEDKDDLNRTMGKLETQISDLESEVEDLKTENRGLEEEISDLESNDDE